MFLTTDELAVLTGRKLKSKQIEWLRRSGIPFRESATGHPVVTRNAIDGKTPPPTEAPRWTPRVIGA